MAKQTFTTGQVLTAAQMTSLQQTAMGGGSATAKTASYTLVAADAGTTVIMNSASSTTITVNTGLFAAGDTVLIQNIGAGTCTVTAGTATVSTAGSLALTQYEAGILYFTATGTALFHDYVQASSNPLTTTGDMIYSSSGSTQARLGIGSTGQVLTVASGLPSWATPSGGMTLINTGGTTLTGSSVTLSSIPGTYNSLRLVLRNPLLATDDTKLFLRINADSGANYRSGLTGQSTGSSISDNGWTVMRGFDNTVDRATATIDLFDYANTTSWKMGYSYAVAPDATTTTNVSLNFIGMIYNQTPAITSITLLPETGNFTSGTAFLYGVK